MNEREIMCAEATTRAVLYKKVFLEINPRASFLIGLQASYLQLY